MKRTLFCGILAVFSLSVAAPAAAQEKVAIVFGGVAPMGTQNFLKSGELSAPDSALGIMKMAAPITPWAEVRLNPAGRVSVGIGYQRWSLKGGPQQLSTKIVAGPHVGETAFSWDETQKAGANVIIGTAYLNLVGHGKVRPFIGGGVGYASFGVTRNIANVWVNPIIQSSATQPQTIRGTVSRIIAKGVGGISVYPASHTIFSVDGGYLNGPAITFGIGFTL